MFSLSMMDYFYPRPPRGGRPGQLKSKGAKNIFLSTPSARRATPSTVILHNAPGYFYPRPPRGGRPEVKKGVNIVFEFLSTPSARRATIAATARETIHGDFYPRPPRGGRRLFSSTSTQTGRISIHALREEGDGVAITESGLQDISIHALREEGDQAADAAGFQRVLFLSTPSARRATESVRSRYR